MIKNLELYLIEFEKNRLRKNKNYINIYLVKNNICRFIIVTTYNHYTFFANNKFKKHKSR